MIDLNDLRAEFGKRIMEQPGMRFSIDAALMDVCQTAYQAGVKDGMAVQKLDIHARDVVVARNLNLSGRVFNELCAAAGGEVCLISLRGDNEVIEVLNDSALHKKGLMRYQKHLETVEEFRGMLAKLTTENARLQGEAATAEKWRGIASAKGGDGRTVQRIEEEASTAERLVCAGIVRRVRESTGVQSHVANAPLHQAEFAIRARGNRGEQPA